MRAIFLTLVLGVLSGCFLSSPPTPRATYRPVPDRQLYARIAKLPGVVGVHLNWKNGFENPNSYGGEIRSARGADKIEILDRALAILRQGRPGASFGGLEVVPPDDFVLGPGHLGLLGPADYTARYGPQPGTGVPPPTPLQRTR
jgi:hypothetical protein